MTYRDDLSAMDRAEAAEKECERLRTELARKPRPEWHFVVGAFGVLLVGMVAMILWLKLYIDREIKACPCLEKDAAQPIPARTYRWTCPASEGALVPPGETDPPRSQAATPSSQVRTGYRLATGRISPVLPRCLTCATGPYPWTTARRGRRSVQGACG